MVAQPKRLCQTCGKARRDLALPPPPPFPQAAGGKLSFGEPPGEFTDSVAGS